MQQNRSRKLMVSLCGLALSSVFLINNKSVVHADTTRGAQNNAISWDSDNDDSQVVSNTQTKTEQADAQKVDDSQQNVQSVQPSRVETSTVSSSSAAPRTINQTAVVQSPHVANVQDAPKANPIVIYNPAGDKVNVHYVDANGNAVDNSSHDYTIDAAKTGQGSYTVPSGYSLNNPDGKYNVNGGTFSAATLKGNVEPHDAQTESRETQSASYEIYEQRMNRQHTLNQEASDWCAEHGITGNVGVKYVHGDTKRGRMTIAGKNYDVSDVPSDIVHWASAHAGIVTSDNGNSHVSLNKLGIRRVSEPVWTNVVVSPAYDVQHLPVAFVDSNNNVVGMVQNYSGKAGTTQNVSLTVPTGYKLADGVSLPTSVTFQNSTDPLLIDVVPSGETQRITNPYRNTINVKFVDQESGQQVGSSVIDLAKVQNGTNYYNVPKGYGADSGTYDISASISTEYNGLTAWNITGSNADNSNPLVVELDLSNDTIKSLYDYFGQDADIHMSVNVPGVYDPETVYLFNSNSSSGRTLTVSDSDSGPNWERELYRAVVTRSDSFLGYSWSLSPDTKQVVSSHTFTDNYHTISDSTVTVPVHKTDSFSFADNSGNVKSVNGNTVDVTLTKPQSVNPAMDTRCQSQATRTIQINFPDGQIPEAYDGIVDKSGKLVQTVHFTRTATEDALTGNILQYGSWTSDNKDHNFIGFEARTLPRIPGYTLKITPVQA